MRRYIVDLNVSTQKMLEFYKGNKKYIVASAQSGQTIRFPLHVLRPFVTSQGICGRFQVSCDPEGKLIDFKAI